MAVATTKARTVSAAPEPDATWSPADNPAVAELLDHIAEELAREYVRLMERAAESEGADADPTRHEK